MLIRHAAKRLLHRLGMDLPFIEKIGAIERNTDAAARQVQIMLAIQYQELLRSGARLPGFDQVQFRAFSQNGEDGILLYIFSLIGHGDKRAIEICAGDGVHRNTANLIVHHGWSALLCDGDARRVAAGREFYRANKDTWIWPPTFVNAWITAENVEGLIATNGFEGNIDLLAIDLDGVDYWIWNAITCIKPRVVVLEYNNLWGPEKAVTVPYRPDFRVDTGVNGTDYSGVSLEAFVKLGRAKGYRLIGCERYNFNAFFMQESLGAGIFPEVPAAQCLDHLYAKAARHARLPKVADRDWVEV